MNSISKRYLVITVVMLVLSACTNQRLVKTGEAKVFDMQVDTKLDWSRIRADRTEVWTIDGTALNRLLIVSRIRSGEHIFLDGKERRSRPDGVWFKAGMPAVEVQTLILDGLRERGWTNVTASSLRPASFGEANGLRFDVNLISQNGLIYRGTVAAAERNERLTIMLWTAPLEHYYPRDQQAVNQMLDKMMFIK